MAKLTLVPDLGIRIRITDCKADWWGTRAQLEAEGFIAKGTLWPASKKPTRMETATAWFCIYRVGNLDTEPNAQTLYHLHHYSSENNHKERLIAKKLREVVEIAGIGGPEWSAAFDKHSAACRDEAFQSFKNKLLGLKKRGRKPSATHEVQQ